MSAESCQKRIKWSAEVFSEESKANDNNLKKKNLYDNLVYGSFWSNHPNPQVSLSGCILLAPALFASMKIYKK